MVAASAPKVAELAARCGDGLISTSPDSGIVERFRLGASDRRPIFGQVTVCGATTEREARRIAHEVWPNTGISGDLKWGLPLPQHFEEAGRIVTEGVVANHVICAPDPASYLGKIREFADAGFDHVCLHQVGPDQDGFFRFCGREILPHIRETHPGTKPLAER
jgi:G6PDH family F420-dependent oxidoreductase